MVAISASSGERIGRSCFKGSDRFSTPVQINICSAAEIDDLSRTMTVRIVILDQFLIKSTAFLLASSGFAVGHAEVDNR